MTQKIAVTGGTGFLGKRLISALLAKSFAVSALTRTPRDNAANLTWHVGDLHNKQALENLLEGCTAVIHCAGLTKALSRDDYFVTNEKGTRALLEAAKKTAQKTDRKAGSPFKRFIQVSSLAAREQTLSDYGASKAAADRLLTYQDWPFEKVILRPPAVYGPGDLEMLQAIKLARGKFGFRLFPSPSGLASKAGFIHADDLSQALIALIAAPIENPVMEIDDGKTGGYSPQEIAAALTQGAVKPAKIFSLPPALRYTIGSLGDAIAMMTEKPSKIMSEQLAYLAHTDWSVHEEKRARIAGWAPQIGLMDGMKQTLDWYRHQNLL